MDVPLEILDLQIAEAHAALVSARRRLAAGEIDDPPNPLADHRRVSSRAVAHELADASGSLAAPVRSWVEALTLDRVLWPDEVRVEAAWRTPSVRVEASGVSARVVSPRDLFLSVLTEQAPARQRVFANALAHGASHVHDAARILAERRAEAARLLGARRDELEIPVDPASAVAAAASRFLSETSALAPRSLGWPAAIATSIGRAYAEGWPARLSPRWLFDLFRAGPLTEGLRPDIPPLPAALGASSFARALGSFGAALANADGPRASFCMGRAPFDPRPHRRAALFASLASDPVFGVSALRLPRGRARDQARGVARALLCGARLDAARVLGRGILGLPAGELRSRFEEHSGQALGVALPSAFAGVIPRLGPGDHVRFAGMLLGASDRRSLVERFDEDWYRSPHAARAIREEDATVAPTRLVQGSALDAGVTEIVRVLGELT